MKNLITKFLAIIGIFIAINSYMVNAKLIAKDIVCSDKASLSFDIKYICTKDVCPSWRLGKAFKAINISVTSDGKNYDMEWEVKPLRIDEEDGFRQVISKDYMLDPGLTYDILFDDWEEKTEYTVICPNVEYRCDTIDLHIDLCDEENFIFSYLFSGLGEQFSNEELIDNIIYYINPAKDLQMQISMAEALPDIFEVKSIGSDRYVFSVNSLDLKNQYLEDFYIEVKNCDKSRYKVSKYKTCKTEQCTDNRHCPIGSYCDLGSNKCKVLNCDLCEKLSDSGHECISVCKSRSKCEEVECINGVCKYNKKENCCEIDSDCNDNLVCTEDSCENSECINKEIGCKESDDPCIVGICEEPTGCRYIKNPECTDNVENQISTETESTKKIKETSGINVPESLSNSLIKLTSITKSLLKDKSIELSYKGINQTITVGDVGTDSTELLIDGRSERLNLLQSLEKDIDGDGVNDIKISLMDIKDGKADLNITQLGEKKQSKEQSTRLPLVIIIFVVGAILSGAFFVILKRKKKPKGVDKKEKEIIEEKPKKTAFGKISEPITVSNFTLKAGKNLILDNVSFVVKSGEMVCLLGPSGTGKSTIIESLVGRRKPTKGDLKILGQNISKNKKIYDYVGFVPQHAELYMNQTVMQNLLSSATKWGIKDAKEKAERILSKIGLSNRKDLKANKLSGGQQKLLSLGMELIRDIEVCILDEPTTGLDPNTRNNIITILSHISTQLHKTIFFTTHFMDDAEECDDVIILANSKIVAQGSPAKLEKTLPGGGRVVNIILDNVTDDLLENIEKIEGVKKLVREGRNLRVITDEPNAIQLGQKIDEMGGIVNETKIDKATMMEVFVYHTGKNPE